MRDRPHWSYSSISQYVRCPLQYFFQRVLGLPSRTTSNGLVLGSAVHAALAEYHRRLQCTETIVAGGILKVFHDAWDERESAGEITYRDGDTRDDSLSQGVQLLNIYLKEPPPVGIVSIEQEMLVPLVNSRGEYLEQPLLAVTDLVTQVDGHLKVTEFKTSGRAYSESEVTASLQPTCYVHAVSEMYGRQASIEYTVLIKTKIPKVQRLTTSRYTTDFGRLGDLVESVQRAVDLGIFYPVESPMNCATCAYRQPCREWGAGPAIHPPQFTLPILSEVSPCSPKCTEKEGVCVNPPDVVNSAAL